MFDEIGAAVKAKVADDFEALGITLKQMFLGSVSPTEETQKAIDERAAMGAIGDMGKYMQYQAARRCVRLPLQAARRAARPARASAWARAWAWASGMARMISQAMQSAMQGQQAPAGGSAAAAAPEVMTLAEAAAYMRVSEADVEQLIASGQIKAKKIGSAYRISKKALDTFPGGMREGLPMGVIEFEPRLALVDRLRRAGRLDRHPPHRAADGLPYERDRRRDRRIHRRLGLSVAHRRNPECGLEPDRVQRLGAGRDRPAVGAQPVLTAAVTGKSSTGGLRSDLLRRPLRGQRGHPVG